jgi:ribosomal protein S18 acetylase RimI-like enzyme
MTSSIEIRLATRNDLDAVERLKIKIFSSQPHPAMGQLPLEVQVKVRLALNEATGNLPGQIFGAFDGSCLVGVTSFETAENLRFPKWKDFSILRPLGFWGILRLMFIVAISYYPSNPHEAYFHGTAIESEYRRRGIAEQLRMAAEQQALHMGKDLAVVIVSRENIASIKLAKKLGYHEVANRHNFLRPLFLGAPKFIRLEKQIVPRSSNRTCPVN